MFRRLVIFCFVLSFTLQAEEKKSLTIDLGEDSLQFIEYINKGLFRTGFEWESEGLVVVTRYAYVGSSYRFDCEDTSPHIRLPKCSFTVDRNAQGLRFYENFEPLPFTILLGKKEAQRLHDDLFTVVRSFFHSASSRKVLVHKKDSDQSFEYHFFTLYCRCEGEEVWGEHCSERLGPIKKVAECKISSFLR